MGISTIMILAAGLGKRMKLYTKNVPKPLIKIGGETLIEKMIKKLEIKGFKKVVINIFYLKNKIKKKLDNKISFNEVLKSIKKRDKSDYNRKISPLKKTKDSILINTTNLTKRACFLKIKKIMDKKVNT